MKRSLFRSRPSKLSSFTLVELLVVIGIIAILAAVLSVAAGSAIRAANRAKALATATQIQTAVMNYYTEYSAYPVPSGTTTDVYYNFSDNTDWTPLTQALCGNFSPYTGVATTGTLTVTNTRAIAFLSLKKTDVDVNNCPVNPATPSTTAAPYFNIALDGDYTGIIGDSGTDILPDFSSSSFAWTGTTTGTPTAKPSAGVAVWANCNNNMTTANAGLWIHTY